VPAWLRGLLVASLSVALLAGCGGDGGAPFPGAGSAAVGEGGRLFYAIAEGPGNLDPLHAGTFSAEVVARQLFEPLLGRLRGPYAAGNPPRAGLALGSAHSRDFRVWSFRLRPGVRFQDGTPLDATAVAANAERWLSDPAGQRLVPGLLAAAAPRPNTVRLILADPLPDLPVRLADPRLGIVSPPALQPESGVGARFVGARDAGSGPFRLRGRVASVAVLVRNRRWWGSDLGLGPSLDEVVFRVVPDDLGRAGLLRSGAVRVASGFGARRAEAIRRDPLLTAVGGSPISAGSAGEGGGEWVAFERSVRGIEDSRPSALSGVWVALLASG
jgi:peptide/nickel transport system substrate-binding protein